MHPYKALQLTGKLYKEFITILIESLLYFMYYSDKPFSEVILISEKTKVGNLLFRNYTIIYNIIRYVIITIFSIFLSGAFRRVCARTFQFSTFSVLLLRSIGKSGTLHPYVFDIPPISTMGFVS